MPVTPGTRLGPYEILAPIGAGGMGEVYTATDTRLGRTVALKVLPAGVASDPERRRRFEQEARAVAALSHPHICVLHDIGSQDGVDFLVMEYLEGETLATRLRRGPLPLSEALAYGAQMADALGAAHRRGIVHRDLKPGNVMLTPTGVKLLDFGLAKLKPAATEVLASQSVLTTVAPEETSGALVGTVPYMAPEQLEGKALDARTDVFALGCVLYEMLTGRRAFEGASSASVITAILTSEPASVSALQPVTPPLLDRLVRTCLAKDPAKRWDSAHDVAEQLRAISDTSAWRAAPPAPSAATGTGWRWTWRRIALASAAVLVVVAAVVVFAPRILRPTQPAPVASTTPSVLALPCKVFGAPEVAFLTDAVPQTMSTLLAQVDGLDTKAPPSSLEVEKVKGDLTRLAELYGVSSFIVTSITASPTRYALNVQLVDAATRNVRWGHQYEGARDSYNDLVRQAADGIRLGVTPNTSPVPTAGVSSEAELAFREGTFSSNRYNNLHNQRDFDLALAAFERAVALAPGLADAAGEIAMLYVYRFESGTMPARETIPAIERWASRALAINPCSVRGLSALGAVELERPVQSTRRVVEYGLKAASCAAANGRAQFALGYGADVGGLTGMAIAAYLECYRLDPLYVYAPLNAAFWLRGMGRPDEALRLLDQALTTEPDMDLLLFERILNLVDQGRLAEAETSLKRLEARAEKNPQVRMLAPMVRAALSLAASDRRAADAALTQVFSGLRSEQGTGSYLSFAYACVAPALAHRGRITEAVDILERGVAVGAVIPYEFLMRNRDLAFVGSDPRFPGILARSKLQFDETRGILERARTRGELPAYLHEPLDELAQLLRQNEQKH